MPTYLCHGFRWSRNSIRVFAQFQNIDNAAPDWVIRKNSSHALLHKLYEIFDFIPFAEDLTITPISSSSSDTPRLLKKRSRARFLNRLGLGSDKSTPVVLDWDELPKPTPLGQPPVIPKLLLPPGSETIVLPPGQKPPPMPPRFPEAEEHRARIVREDPEDPILCNNAWSALRLLEEWDLDAFKSSSSSGGSQPKQGQSLDTDTNPEDDIPTHWTRPWAYVTDYAVRLDFSGRILDEITHYKRLQSKLAPQHKSMGDCPLDDDPAAERAAQEASVQLPVHRQTAGKKKGWFQVLRDNMEPEGAIQWYVVVCEDDTREYPRSDSSGNDGDYDDLVDEQDVAGETSQTIAESSAAPSELNTMIVTESESHAASALIAGVEKTSIDPDDLRRPQTADKRQETVGLQPGGTSYGVFA